MLCVPTRRRRMTSLLLLFLIVPSAGVLGCGAGKISQVTSNLEFTTAGSYTFTVKGEDVTNPSATSTATVIVAVE